MPGHVSRRTVLLGAAAAAVVLDASGAIISAPQAAAASPQQWPALREHESPEGAPTVDVRDFGAVGDGSTNDVAAFRAALSDLDAAGGGTLLVPPGRYLVNGRIDLISNLRISGSEATLLKTAVPDGAWAWFVGVSGDRQGYGAGVVNVLVEGLTFQASFEQPLTACAFALHHAQDVIVDNCRFIQAQGRGHSFDLGGCRRITVRNSIFAGFLNLGGKSYNHTECIQLDQSMPGSLTVADDAAGMDALFTRDVKVLNCQFLPLEVGGVRYPCPNPLGAHAVREDHHWSGVEFRGNRVVDPIEDIPRPGQDEANVNPWAGVIHFPGVQGLVIADNEFTLTEPRVSRAIYVVSVNKGALDTQPPLPVIEHGTFPPVTSSDIAITGNVFRGFGPGETSPAQEVIKIRGLEDGTIRDVTITGNTFDNHGAGADDGTWAIRTERCDRVTIADNVFRTPAGAVQLTDTTKLMVRHNETAAESGSAPAAYSVTGTSSGTLVRNRASGYSAVVDTSGAEGRIRVV